MENIADKVRSIFMDCLFKEEELPSDGSAPPDAVLVDGVMGKIGFHPGRIEKHKEEIREILNLMPIEFHKKSGGGWSFLQLCMTQAGEHWAEHITVDQLISLGLAVKMAIYCAPREYWKVLPGGMPYVQFDTEVS